ncbi:glycosyltransferase [bacterium]|nr:glycosyltransferase [bacterium]
MSNKSPLVSIIFAAYNESAHAERLLKSIKDQTYLNIEPLVVVDKKTTDNTLETAKKYAPKSFLGGMERSENRNMGIQKSSGDYLLLLDADMILTAGVVEECVNIMIKDPQIKTITVPEKSIGDSFWAKCKAFERNFYFIEGDTAVEASRFFEKKAVVNVGGYDANITGPEDWDLPERINLEYPKKARTKSYIIHNEGNVSLFKLMKKKNYYAKLAHVYMKKHSVSTFSTKTIYFLRPVFYKHWKLWFKNPVIGLGTIFMLTMEFIAGGVGFLQGKFSKV